MFLFVEIIHGQIERTGITFRYPRLVAFTFELLHGLGFAGALSDIGLPKSEIGTALLFFNVGVEIGQLMFVGVVLLLIRALKQAHMDSLIRVRVFPAYVIGTLAAYWPFAEGGCHIYRLEHAGWALRGLAAAGREL